MNCGNHGEAYRLSLEILATKNKLEKHVIFYNQFVDPENLKEFMGAADLYITPYLNEAQITSGTLVVCLRLRQSDRFDALLARSGFAGRRPRRTGAVCRFFCDG